MGVVYKSLNEMEDDIKANLSRYLFENNADYVAFLDQDCISKVSYRKKSFTDFGEKDNEIDEVFLNILAPILITALEKGNCDRLGLEFTAGNFEVNLSRCKESKAKVEGSKFGVNIINTNINEKTAAFEIRKINADYDSKINGTFVCHKELFQKLESSSNIDYFLIAYFKDYFMDDILTKEKEFNIKANKILSLSLTLKELIDLKKI